MNKNNHCDNRPFSLTKQVQLRDDIYIHLQNDPYIITNIYIYIRIATQH